MSTYLRETMKEAGYTYSHYDHETREHYLRNTLTGLMEVFVASKGFAGWAIKYKNTDLEFCRSISKT